MVLIAIGSISIVLNANTEQVNFTPDEVRDLLLTPRTMIYTGLCFGCFVAENFMLRSFYSKLRDFEQDALAYEENLRSNSDYEYNSGQNYNSNTLLAQQQNQHQ